MATQFANLLVAVAGFAMVCGVVAASANARADDMSAVAYVPAELMQWHSGLTVSDAPYVKPEWRSTLSATVPEDAKALLVMHGAAGIRDAAEDGLDYSRGAFDAPGRARKTARHPAWNADGPAQRMH